MAARCSRRLRVDWRRWPTPASSAVLSAGIGRTRPSSHSPRAARGVWLAAIPKLACSAFGAVDGRFQRLFVLVAGEVCAPTRRGIILGGRAALLAAESAPSSPRSRDENEEHRKHVSFGSDKLGCLNWPCGQDPGRKHAISRRAPKGRARRRRLGEQDSTCRASSVVSSRLRRE